MPRSFITLGAAVGVLAIGALALATALHPHNSVSHPRTDPGSADSSEREATRASPNRVPASARHRSQRTPSGFRPVYDSDALVVHARDGLTGGTVARLGEEEAPTSSDKAGPSLGRLTLDPEAATVEFRSDWYRAVDVPIEELTLAVDGSASITVERATAVLVRVVNTHGATFAVESLSLELTSASGAPHVRWPAASPAPLVPGDEVRILLDDVPLAVARVEPATVRAGRLEHRWPGAAAVRAVVDGRTLEDETFPIVASTLDSLPAERREVRIAADRWAPIDLPVGRTSIAPGVNGLQLTDAPTGYSSLEVPLGTSASECVLSLALAPPPLFRFRVSDAVSGALLDRVRILPALDPDAPNLVARGDRASMVRADGTEAIRLALPPSDPIATAGIAVGASGYQTRVVEEWSKGPAEYFVETELRPSEVRRVVVTDPTGAPIPRRVRLFDSTTPSRNADWSGRPLEVEAELDLARCVAIVELSDLSTRESWWPVPIARAITTEQGSELALAVGTLIVDGDGSAPVRALHSSGRSLVARADGTGRSEFRTIPIGRWLVGPDAQVAAASLELARGTLFEQLEGELERIDLFPGDTAAVRLDPGGPRSFVSGQLRTIGVNPADLWVMVDPDPTSELLPSGLVQPFARVGPSGSFELGTPVDEDSLLLVVARQGSGDVPTDLVVLGAGPVGQDLEARAGRITIHAAWESTAPWVAFLTYALEGRTSPRLLLTGTTNEPTTFGPVPTGACVLSFVGEGGERIEREIQVQADQTLELQVDLGR